ncbi:MAG: hypothetical protein U9R75_10755 [Candidatus Thermoplasmatota archaeon]|nr:hypothetical protein [Candidatus Thermoplasmatota archaeon]
MKYGDKDGFKDIYDENGELVLHRNEKKLVVEENVVPTLKSTWRYYGGDYLLEPSKGTIYLTNERLVFINIPERMFAIGGEDEARAVSTSDGHSFELGNSATGAAQREFFEIPNIEIMASEKKEGAVSLGEMVNVFILSSGNQFHLSMVLTSDSDLLKRLMNKKVQDLDELVNNLKDFFRKTDWMFNDAEKKLYQGLSREPGPTISDQKVDVRQKPAIQRENVAKPSIPSRPAPVMKQLPKVSGKLGKQSIEYFENLYRKGLIKEEIYSRLIGEYGGKTVVQNHEPTSPHETEEYIPDAPSIEPEAPPEQVSKMEDPPGDDELLSMLDETLSDFTDEAEPADADPVDENEKTVVKRVRTLRR